MSMIAVSAARNGRPSKLDDVAWDQMIGGPDRIAMGPFPVGMARVRQEPADESGELAKPGRLGAVDGRRVGRGDHFAGEVLGRIAGQRAGVVGFERVIEPGHGRVGGGVDAEHGLAGGDVVGFIEIAHAEHRGDSPGG